MALYISVVSVHTVTCEPLLVGHEKDLQFLDFRNSGIYTSNSTIFDDILWYIYLPINWPTFLCPELCQRAKICFRDTVLLSSGRGFFLDFVTALFDTLNPMCSPNKGWPRFNARCDWPYTCQLWKWNDIRGNKRLLLINFDAAPSVTRCTSLLRFT